MTTDLHDPLPYCDCGACAIVERDRLRAGLRDLIEALADVLPYGIDLSDTNAPGHGHEQGRKTMTTETHTKALRAALDTIWIERTSFADCHVRHDGTIDPSDATILREYDEVLAKLRAALAEHTSMAEEIERLRAELAEANTPTIFWDDDWNAARGIGDSLYEVIESAFDDVTAVAGPRYVRVGRARELPAITVRAWIDGEGALQWEKAHDAAIGEEK